MYVHVLPWYMYIVLYEILWTALRYLLVCVLVYSIYRYWNVVLREMGEGQAGQVDPLARPPKLVQDSKIVRIHRLR